MSESNSPLGESPSLVFLPELPESIVDSNPVETRIQELPFHELSWQDFERLVYRLVRKQCNVEYSARYGRPGQAQHGIDVYGRLRSGGHVCWQVRDRQNVVLADIKGAVDDFLNGRWSTSAKQFIYCVSGSLLDAKIQDAIEVEATRLNESGIVFKGIDCFQLCDELRDAPEIVDDFFGREWLRAFLGEGVATNLKRPLAAQHVIELRRRLAAIYSVRAQQLDPGLNVESSRLDKRDVRERFVIPSVDQTDPLSDTTIKPDDLTVERIEDDQNWQFAEYTDTVSQPNFRRVPIEPNDSHSLALDSWLMQGDTPMLISGAPGSGKSTVLRCLALDLINEPVLFPTLRERFGVRIPLLIPFSLWCRSTAKNGREVGLLEVINETFGAIDPENELQELFNKALLDNRLLLLIDGLDEYANEQAARLTLSTIETFIGTHHVLTILTSRPSGLRRLGLPSPHWATARLTELFPNQQREFVTKLLVGAQKDSIPVNLRVDQFFKQLEQSDRLQSLAGNPLLLHGMLSVAVRQIMLPNSRFQLFEQLIQILLEIHPNRRATAAAEVEARSHVFSRDELKKSTLANLAFEIHKRGADAGFDRAEAQRAIVEFLTDDVQGAAWSINDARLGARELIDVDADTSGLLVEYGPGELAFCHAAFREHLAGLEIATWQLKDQLEFVSRYASTERWRGSILALLQSTRRPAEVEQILQAIKVQLENVPDSTDLRLLLAEAAFITTSSSGPIARQAALDSLNRIETGTDDVEKTELLGLALDGPRIGPIGDSIKTRLARWWPGVTEWQQNFYVQLGNWNASEVLAQTLRRAILGDRNQLAAAASLARVFEGNEEVGDWLKTYVHDSSDPSVSAASLYALSTGWSTIDGLDTWLLEAEQSPSIQLQIVASLALHRLGRRSIETRDSLLRTLNAPWSPFNGSINAEIIDALVEDWSEDVELHDECWSAINQPGTRDSRISKFDARTILLRLYRQDPRVSEWVEKQIESRDHFPFDGFHPGDEQFESIFNECANVQAAVENWFEENRASPEPIIARLAILLKSESAKHEMLRLSSKSSRLRFWPIWSLLTGWGMDDPEVANTLRSLINLQPEVRQNFAHHIPSIARSTEESNQMLLEICDLDEVSRVDFVIQGFAQIHDAIEEERTVTAILPHVRDSPSPFGGESGLITKFHSEPRVREYAIQRMRRRSPPLISLAAVYAEDEEISSLILERAAPLPTKLRRYIAKRASQSFDDKEFRNVLNKCELETDEHAQVQATIGRSYAALSTTGETQQLAKTLGSQLEPYGLDFEAQRVAAFAGLLALERLDLFASAREEYNGEPLKVDLFSSFKDYTPVLELAADRWEYIEAVIDGSPGYRLSDRNYDDNVFWRAFAPHIERSSLLKSKFLEYCEDEAVVLNSSGLLAIARLGTESSLLLDCCKRVLTAKHDDRNSSPTEFHYSKIVAAKYLAGHASEDLEAMQDLVDISEKPESRNAALVGLASHWPNHEVVAQAFQSLFECDRIFDWLICTELWLVSAQGTSDQMANALGNFVTRDYISPWDFPQDSLAAFQARLKRDPDFEESLRQFAVDNDEPSIRASIIRLLTSGSSTRVQSLAEEFLLAEQKRTNPQRFAMDILTNRVRPMKLLIQEALRKFTN